MEQKYQHYETERDVQLRKYNDETNLLKKALHFRNAVQADIDKENVSVYLRDDVPNTQDVMELGAGSLSMVKTGMIWCKMGNSFASGGNTHTLLGSAVIRSNDGVHV